MLGMLGLFEYLPKKEAEIQLIQLWLQLIQTREQLIQTRISCVQGATPAVSSQSKLNQSYFDLSAPE